MSAGFREGSFGGLGRMLSTVTFNDVVHLPSTCLWHVDIILTLTIL